MPKMITNDITEEDVDSAKFLTRKPIGWNYQNAYAMNHAKKTQVPKSYKKSKKKFARNNSSDDIQIIEVLKATSSKVNNNSRSTKIINKSSETMTQTVLPFKSGTIFATSILNEESIRKNIKENIVIPIVTAGSVFNSNGPTHTHVKISSNEFKVKEVVEIQENNKGCSKNEEMDKGNKKGLAKNHEESTLSKEGSSSDSIPINPENSLEYSTELLEKFIERWKTVQKFGNNDEKIKNKILDNFKLCHYSYKQSNKFTDGLKIATGNLTESNSYVFIKDIIDNLKRYRGVPYLKKKKASKEDDVDTIKLENKLHKIEKTMVKLSKEIERLENEDIDLDDEDNSSYLVLDRMKKQFGNLDKLYCKLSQCSLSTNRPIEKRLVFESSRYPEINQRISAWVNKKRCFPDYSDVLNLVRNVTQKSQLPLVPETVRVVAQEIFFDLGRELKRRRELDDLFGILSYAPPKVIEASDPAQEDDQLRQRLQANKEEGDKKLNEVFQQFVDKECEERALQAAKKDSATTSLATADGNNTAATADEGKAEKDEAKEVAVDEVLLLQDEYDFNGLEIREAFNMLDGGSDVPEEVQDSESDITENVTTFKEVARSSADEEQESDLDDDIREVMTKMKDEDDDSESDINEDGDDANEDINEIDDEVLSLESNIASDEDSVVDVDEWMGAVKRPPLSPLSEDKWPSKRQKLEPEIVELD